MKEYKGNSSIKGLKSKSDFVTMALATLLEMRIHSQHKSLMEWAANETLTLPSVTPLSVDIDALPPTIPSTFVSPTGFTSGFNTGGAFVPGSPQALLSPTSTSALAKENEVTCAEAAMMIKNADLAVSFIQVINNSLIKEIY